jgi:hypothetical protein
MSERDPPLPLAFRAELLAQVMPALRAGECCSLVGASSVGKSRLVHFLQRPDVQAHYWGDDQIWVVVIDSHALVFGELPDEYVVAELMMHRLIREAERRALPADLVDEFNQKYAHLAAQPSARLALRYLDRICGRLCDTVGVRLVFVFDQFEDLWRSMEARLFLNLRYLRDEYKYRLAYLVLSRERLPRIRQRARGDLQAVEAFGELFNTHVFGLGMYETRDAIAMFEGLEYRSGAPVQESLRQAALQASGRHPGLLRATFWALRGIPAPPVAMADLLRFDPIADECSKLWNDMLPEEQQTIRAIATDTSPGALDPDVLTELRLKGLVQGDPPVIFSGLFATFALGRSRDMAGLVVAPRLRRVWLDGQALDRVLSPLEFGLLEYLARRAGDVCRREEILRELYQDQAYDANDERLDTLLRRLRETLGDDARSPRYLVTHRGVGIQLVNGRLLD